MVVRAQLKAVHTGDDFADDFYAIQRKERLSQPLYIQQSSLDATGVADIDRPAKTLALLKALHRGELLSESIYLPPRSQALPLANNSSFSVFEEKARSQTEHSQAWATNNQVLGRLAKSNIRTPRELILLHETISSGNDKPSFSSSTWQLRSQVFQVCQLLDEIADTNALLQARAAALPRGPVPEEMNQAMQPLELAQQALCCRLSIALGLGGDPAAKEDGSKPDDERLLGLLWVPRGRRRRRGEEAERARGCHGRDGGTRQRASRRVDPMLWKVAGHGRGGHQGQGGMS